MQLGPLWGPGKGLGDDLGPGNRRWKGCVFFRRRFFDRKNRCGGGGGRRALAARPSCPLTPWRPARAATHFFAAEKAEKFSENVAVAWGQVNAEPVRPPHFFPWRRRRPAPPGFSPPAPPHPFFGRGAKKGRGRPCRRVARGRRSTGVFAVGGPAFVRPRRRSVWWRVRGGVLENYQLALLPHCILKSPAKASNFLRGSRGQLFPRNPIQTIVPPRWRFL